MSGISKPDFRQILRTLRAHRADVIVVGGVGAVLQGAPISTFDLDLVHSRKADNVARLLDALDEIDAYYRIQPERKQKPLASHLSSPGHQLLMTRFGPLDLLGSIGHSHRYEDLLPECIEMEVGEGVRIRVLNLETLIAVKGETARDRDVAVLPILRRTLEEQRRRKS